MIAVDWGTSSLRLYRMADDGQVRERRRSDQGVLACAGLVGLAWSIIQFVQQRALSRWERALLPVCIAFSLAGWALRGTVDAQGAAMSATEVIVLLVMLRTDTEIDRRRLDNAEAQA